MMRTPFIQFTGQVLWAIALLLVTPSLGMAQEERTVTLKFEVGGSEESITGELVSFEDNRFTLNATIGPLVVPADGVTCFGAACPESTQPKFKPGQMVLTALDGSFAITGKLVEVVEDHYVVATSVGEMRVKMELVTCKGDGCSTPKVKAVFGGTVVLTNDTTTLKGVLLGLADGAYILEEETLGQLRVKADQFTCNGIGCP